MQEPSSSTFVSTVALQPEQQPVPARKHPADSCHLSRLLRQRRGPSIPVSLNTSIPRPSLHLLSGSYQPRFARKSDSHRRHFVKGWESSLFNHLVRISETMPASPRLPAFNNPKYRHPLSIRRPLPPLAWLLFITLWLCANVTWHLNQTQQAVGGMKVNFAQCQGQNDVLTTGSDIFRGFFFGANT